MTIFRIVGGLFLTSSSFYFLIWSFVFLRALFFLVFNSGFYFDGVFLFDDIRVCLVFLRLFLFYFVLVIDFYSLKNKILLLLMMFFMLGRFMSCDFIFFYIIFEVVFVLIFTYLIEFGSSPFRFQASFYIFFYTLVFSFPFLLYLFYLRGTFFSRNFSVFYFLPIREGLITLGNFFSFFVFIVFMVKLPVYGLHLWLPKAHVEAPIAGSIILAGVFLKLGGYGLYRFFFTLNLFFNLRGSYFLNFLFFLCLLGGIILSFVCIRQRDLKILIAYSSVVHMRVMLLGFLSFTLVGVYGRILVMLAHGFISPLIFSLITSVYRSLGSRRIILLKGVNIVSLVFIFYWFFRCFINLGVPPFMSFFGEVFIFGLLGSFLRFCWFFIILLIFFTGVYCVYIYVSLSHGEKSFFFDLNIYRKNALLWGLHLIFVILYPLIYIVWSFSLK